MGKVEPSTTEMISRFWECFKAIKGTDKRVSGKTAYREATRQLGYRPPLSKEYLAKGVQK